MKMGVMAKATARRRARMRRPSTSRLASRMPRATRRALIEGSGLSEGFVFTARQPASLHLTSLYFTCVTKVRSRSNRLEAINFGGRREDGSLPLGRLPQTLGKFLLNSPGQTRQMAGCQDFALYTLDSLPGVCLLSRLLLCGCLALPEGLKIVSSGPEPGGVSSNNGMG